MEARLIAAGLLFLSLPLFPKPAPAMLNKEIAAQFGLLAKLMEIHDENTFKIRSYQNAAFQLGRLEQPLEKMSPEEMASIQGVGDAISKKITQILETGELPLLQKYLEKTPAGLIEMLGIKGIGGRKLGFIWRELGIETPGELLYACYENRLAKLKGFGAKTQENVIQALEYYNENRNKFHYAELEPQALELQRVLSEQEGVETIYFSGELRRRAIVLERIDLLVVTHSGDTIDKIGQLPIWQEVEKSGDRMEGETITGAPFRLRFCHSDQAVWTLFRETGNDAHLDTIEVKADEYRDEMAIYKAAGKPFVVPEMREGRFEWEWHKEHTNEELISLEDIKGVVHAHSTYSDGGKSLKDMAMACMDMGYEYLAISDHSQSAFYANGLTPDRVHQQQDEIADLNSKLAPFRIFSGIESDILNDGSLDYEEKVLASFDFIVASVHSNLKMPEEKSMMRVLNAVQNKYTTILGHPTGRLLLSRPGYPVDHEKLIETAKAHNVVIELNANPYRLDMDWQYIYQAMKAGVWMSINPDAHSIEGIKDIKYGVYAARKGGMLKSQTLNALSAEDFAKFLEKRKTGTSA